MEFWISFEKWFVLISIALLLGLLIMNIVPAALAFFVLASVFLIFNIVSVPEFLSTFSNSALITLVLLLLCSLAVEKSVFIQYLSKKIISDNEKISFFRLTFITSILSAFINNTAVVASFLGVVSRQTTIAPSRLLIPLSYASIFGGITTLIGTSTNLVVNSFVTKAGLPPLGMFTFTGVGMLVAGLSLAALYFKRNSLPYNPPQSTDESDNYFLTVRVEAESDLIGKTVRSSKLGELDGLYLLEIVRADRLISPVSRREVILAGDQIVFTGSVENVHLLQPFQNVTLLGGDSASQLLKSNLVEVIISNESELLYTTLEAVNFNERFSASVVGIRRGNKRLTGYLNRIPLRTGDALLLAVSDNFFHLRSNETNFHLLDKPHQNSQRILSVKKSVFVMLAFLLVIILSAFELVPLFKGLIVLLGALLAGDCLRLSDLRWRFPFDLIFVIGSALVLSIGLENSGAAAMIGQAMMRILPENNAYLSFVVIFLMTVMMTEIITNNAAAALSMPLALQTAESLQVSYLPFVVGICFAASACFMIPFGYQTHLMVYTPGRYTVKNYLRTGWAVSLAYMLAALVLIPIFFPFHS